MKSEGKGNASKPIVRNQRVWEQKTVEASYSSSLHSCYPPEFNLSVYGEVFMKSLRNVLAACLLLLCLAPCVQAQSLKLKRQMVEWDKELSSYIDRASDKCGKKFAAELDVDSWKPAEGQETYSFGGYCGNGCVFALEMLCRDDLGKEAVASKVDKIVCHHKPSDSKHVEINLADKTLECTFSLHDMQFQETTKKELENML